MNTSDNGLLLSIKDKLLSISHKLENNGELKSEIQSIIKQIDLNQPKPTDPLSECIKNISKDASDEKSHHFIDLMIK